MKSRLFAIGTTLALIGLTACANGDKEVRDAARESLGPGAQESTTPSVPPPSSSTFTNTTAAATGMVHHYICPKNCEGSGGAAAGTCPVCGSEYIHNQAYHQQQTATPAAGGGSQITIPGSTPSTATPAPTPEPAQNAAGVWHYTCAKGCAGGSGSAGTCATCGGPLTHNTAYHQ